MDRDDDRKNISALAGIDRIIHEPARLSILTYLYVIEGADFLFLERQTGLTRGNLSSHLSKLEKAGYVKINKEFIEKIPHTLIMLTDKGRQAFRTYKENLKKTLDGLPD